MKDRGASASADAGARREPPRPANPGLAQHRPCPCSDPWPHPANLSRHLGKRLFSWRRSGQDFRPPKFNSPGGSRKPSAGAGRAVAVGVPRRIGEVPECRGPRPCTLLNPARPRPLPAGRRSLGPARPGRSSAADVCAQGRDRGFGAEAPGSRGPGSRPSACDGLRVSGGGLAAALGGALPPKSLPLLHSLSPFCKTSQITTRMRIIR